MPAVNEPLVKLRLQLEVLMNFNAKTLERCSKYLNKWTDDHITFILEHLIGFVRGVERAQSKYVELYMKKVQGFVMAINRINYAAFDVEYTKKLLKELTQDRAVAMGMMRRSSDGLFTPTGLDFPQHVADFKIFY